VGEKGQKEEAKDFAAMVEHVGGCWKRIMKADNNSPLEVELDIN
jgi:hypothetical protein